MKKIIALLLALVCVAAVAVSCKKNGTDETLSEINTVMENAIATGAEAEIVYKDANGDVLFTMESTLSEEPDKDTDKYGTLTVPYYNYFEIRGDEVIAPEFETDELSAGVAKRITVDPTNLTFNSNFFDGGEYTYERMWFETVVTDSEGFFGTDLGSEEIEFRLRITSGFPKKMEIKYETEMGYFIEIAITFSL